MVTCRITWYKVEYKDPELKENGGPYTFKKAIGQVLSAVHMGA